MKIHKMTCLSAAVTVSAPDMFAAYAETAYVADQLGKAVDLSQCFSEEELAQYVDGYLESGVLLDALEAAVSEVNSFQLYTVKPFARSAEAKPFCRNHLPRGTKHSAQDYRQRQMIDAGRTRNGKTSV